MVDVALSVYGSKWVRHILNSWQHVMPGVCLSCCLVGCSTDKAVTDTDVSQAEISSEQFRAFYSAVRDHLVASAADEATAQRETDPGAFIQSDSAFEFWLFIAVLTDSAGEQYALQQSYTRLRFKPDELQTNDSEQSHWDFSQMMAIDYRMEALDRAVASRAQQAQRMALSLAGLDLENNKIWVSGFTASKLRQGNCRASYALESPDVTLQFQQSDCMNAEAGTATRVARSSSMAVTGEAILNDETIPLSGRGWAVHVWGIPPDTEATAVVFDQAWLWLDESLAVQIQRSRRRSGRGPSITSGSVSHVASTEQLAGTNNQSRTRELLNPAFVDVEPTDNVAAQTWRFMEQGNNIDTQIQSIQADNQPVLGTINVLDIVRVNGTHEGIGFVSKSR